MEVGLINDQIALMNFQKLQKESAHPYTSTYYPHLYLVLIILPNRFEVLGITSIAISV